jgi:polysaccharide biosynthesis protein PslH
MKILWAKSDFLHPTSRGGQIRTLETIKRLHARHEVHYIAYEKPDQPEGPERSSEYCSYVYPIKHPFPPRRSVAFAMQMVSSLLSPLPPSIARYTSEAMRSKIAELRAKHAFDSIVCDFLTPAQNFDSLKGCVLFQHNVETMIWRRHAEHAATPIHRTYFNIEASRTFECEQRACKEAAHIIAVSDGDAAIMRDMFGVSNITPVATGVDVDYFRRPAADSPHVADLVFLGSMDWMPNVDGVGYFVREILPRIRQRRPDCTVAVVGRSPFPEIAALPASDPKLQVTGTVPDVRPYLWGSTVSIVPLRVGGGTRLKIYESMAAGIPIVSTTIGAEGLDVSHGDNIRLADTAETFADECINLLDNAAARQHLSVKASHLVTSRFSWDRITRQFEDILVAAGNRSRVGMTR